MTQPAPVRISYPPDLPGPRIGDVDPQDRARRSKGNGYSSVSTRSFDRISAQKLVWNLNAADAESWQDWWEDGLYLGAMWFSATWPHPRGFESIERHFTTTPVWSHVGVGVYQVSVDCEVRDLVSYALESRITEDLEERITMDGETRLIM